MFAFEHQEIGLEKSSHPFAKMTLSSWFFQMRQLSTSSFTIKDWFKEMEEELVEYQRVGSRFIEWFRYFGESLKQG